MSHLRPRATEDASAVVRKSARVRTVAEMLEEDESQIRRLLKTGELSGHSTGKRGVRIYLDSVAAYQERREFRGIKRKPLTKARAKAAGAAHEHAMAELRKLGLVP